jgi:predicted alpha/beta superfamily hydrolase
MNSSTPTPVLNGMTRMMQSAHTGKGYRITITLPLGYDKTPDEGWPFNDLPALFPVVYVLDGNWYADMVTGMIRPMSWCGSTHDAIVVGIGYPEGTDAIEAFRESFTRRNADLTPVRDEAEEQAMEAQHHRPTPSGDATNFHKFLQEELIPLVERDYRADPAKRILVGHSYGGLFAACAMLETPDLFSTWIVGSPTLSYGNRVAFQREEAFAKTHTALPTTVYLFVGELEESRDDTTLTDTLRWAAILKSRNYEGFALIKHVFGEQSHCAVAAPGIHAGLKLALKR